MIEAKPSDYPLVVDILCKSFDQNKSVNFVVHQDAQREKRLRGLMQYSIEICSAFGKVWILENKKACALVLYPDQKKTTIAAIMADVKLALSVITPWRVSKVLGRESLIKKNHPKMPFAYLWFIGVDPAEQGNGYGSELLSELLSFYNIDNRPVYLETSVDRNIPWYKSFGFETYNSVDLGYTLYCMKRN